MIDSNTKTEQFIASGILELYCLGIISPELREEVDLMIQQHEAVQLELKRIEETFEAIAAAENKIPPVGTRDKVLLAIEAAELGLPPLLSRLSSVEEWECYLSDNNIGSKSAAENFLWVDLPSTPNVISYAVWAPKGIALEEEHDQEEERLLMLKGSCKITIDEIATTYYPGNFIVIPANTVHKAEACSIETMVLIGQRIKL